MKLVELKIGQLCTRAQRYCNSITCRTCWVGCVQIHVSSSATGKDDCICFQFAMFTALCNDFEPSYLSIFERQITRKGVFKHFYVRVPQRTNEGHFNGEAGRIALRMQNACTRVSSF